MLGWLFNLLPQHIIIRREDKIVACMDEEIRSNRVHGESDNDPDVDRCACAREIETLAREIKRMAGW